MHHRKKYEKENYVYSILMQEKKLCTIFYEAFMIMSIYLFISENHANFKNCLKSEIHN